MDAEKSQNEPQKQGESPPRDPGRVVAAWKVLRGERLVPIQIQADWAEYQLIFGDILKRFSALMAREAKAEKRRLKRQTERKENQEQEKQTSLALPTDKSKLREIARQRGLGIPPSMNGGL